ncbi:MAG: RodZ domain-containing protein [Porticoccaceae bacterium]
MKHDDSGAQDVRGPGQALRELRMEARIPDSRVLRELGITASLLQALETDDYRRLPHEVFVKGYLRRYAQLVGARPAAILASYQQRVDAANPGAKQTLDNAAPRPVKAMAISAATLLLATSLVFGAMLSDGPVATDVPPVAAPAPADLAVVASLNSPGAENRLELKFVADSWVEIVDAQEYILAVSLQRAGDHLHLEGEPPFRISLGNAAGVRLSYLGKPVTLSPQADGQAVEFILGTASKQ